ncbi:MAG: hypothetical protein WBF17_25720 [Phycisphaerae bacterium]
MELSVGACYALAWRSFSKWWIPLCLISGVIVVFQLVPQLLVRSDVNELQVAAYTLATAVSQNDAAKVQEISSKLTAQMAELAHKLARLALLTFPLIGLLTVVLLMYANWAVRDRHERRRPLAVLMYIALVHVVLAIGKLAAFLFCFVPGAYLYIKLLFVSLIMLEEKKGAAEAIAISWRMTRGNFWRLFLLILMNTGIQMLSVPTIIGAIPATGFANTARAAAFRMIGQARRWHAPSG